MKEKEVFYPFPKLENPLYKLAEKQKMLLREEALKRIKDGTFENGIASLYEAVGGLTREEINSILKSWEVNEQELLKFWYYFPLIQDDLESIKRADKGYLSVLADKFTKKGRI